MEGNRLNLPMFCKLLAHADKEYNLAHSIPSRSPVMRTPSRTCSATSTAASRLLGCRSFLQSESLGPKTYPQKGVLATGDDVLAVGCHRASRRSNNKNHHRWLAQSDEICFSAYLKSGRTSKKLGLHFSVQMVNLAIAIWFSIVAVLGCIGAVRFIIIDIKTYKFFYDILNYEIGAPRIEGKGKRVVHNASNKQQQQMKKLSYWMFMLLVAAFGVVRSLPLLQL